MVKKACFFQKKKHFHLFKSLVYKNGKAQKMPVVAGHLFPTPVQLSVGFAEHGILNTVRNLFYEKSLYLRYSGEVLQE